jgi:hypothetical protein
MFIEKKGKRESGRGLLGSARFGPAAAPQCGSYRFKWRRGGGPRWRAGQLLGRMHASDPHPVIRGRMHDRLARDASVCAAAKPSYRGAWWGSPRARDTARRSALEKVMQGLPNVGSGRRNGDDFPAIDGDGRKPWKRRGGGCSPWCSIDDGTRCDGCVGTKASRWRPMETK